jgi:DNA-3-methyladenine glycosylase
MPFAVKRKANFALTMFIDMRLSHNFFKQKTLKVAQQLLSCFLIRKIGNKKIIARIIETEAYCGPKDLANHASKGRTERTKVMFGPAGHVYIYLVYGMYYCLNIVTEKVGYPAAVLIRGIEITPSIKIPSTKSQTPNKSQILNSKFQKRITNNEQQTIKIIGPGKVCRGLKIDKSLDGVDLIKDKRLYFVQVRDDLNRPHPLFRKIKSLPRVGVDYAKEYKDKKWRFVLFESRKS